MTGEVVIRPFSITDITFLEEMLYEALYVPYGEDPFPKSILKSPEISKYIQNWGSSSYDIALIAVLDHEKVGAIWGRQFTEENRGYGFVDGDTPEISLAVIEEYRSKGVGTRLMKGIESTYLKLGVKKLSLSVDRRNPAFGLYQRLGFRHIEYTGTSVTMLKDISG